VQAVWQALLPAVAALLLVAGLAVWSQPVQAAQERGRYSAEEIRFLELLNEYRRDNGLGALVLSDTLALAAERHSQDMARYSYFGHETAGSDHFPAGSWPWDRMRLSGYTAGSAMGENLAAGMGTAESALSAWKASPAHDDVMLSPMWKAVGIAFEDTSGPYRYYWTTNFGSALDPAGTTAGPPPQLVQTATSRSLRSIPE
jgi:uncharacterized protein YkwD